MKKLFGLLTMLVFLSTSLNAQDNDPTGEFSFSGSVDVYFRSNLNAKNSGGNYEAPGTSFGNLPGFSLGMANLVGSYQGEKGGFIADLVFGPRGEDAVFTSPYYSEGRGSSQIINQLYAYYNVTDALTISLGNFNTFLGYEVISPSANFNYSTSYMFSYGPFSHTGLKADLTLSENLTLMAAVMNPTDLTEFNPLGTYTLGFQVGLFGSTYLNFLYGDQDGEIDDNSLTDSFSNGKTFQADITAGFDVTESFFIGFNATYNTTAKGQMYDGNEVQDVGGDGEGFYGTATYLQLRTSETFAIGTRVEYFKIYNNGLDIIGLDANGDGHVLDLTLSGNITKGNLTLIPELRLDATSENSFFDSELDASQNLVSFVMAAVYSF